MDLESGQAGYGAGCECDMMNEIKRTAQLGMGIMRLPVEGKEILWDEAQAVIDEYMKGDFCYFDLHPGYMMGKAQEILKKSVVERYSRDAFYIAAKMPYYVHSSRDYELIFRNELIECGVDYFDYYMLHALTADTYETHESLGGFEFIMKQKEIGKVRFIGISFHDKPYVLEKILKKHPELDFVQLQINFCDWEDPVICAKACYEVARKYNKKIIVMEPIKGGTLLKYRGELSMSELVHMSLGFVSALDGVDVILSGMSEPHQVKENRDFLAAEGNIDPERYGYVMDLIQKKKSILCTRCGYCMQECPQNIAIPDILALLNSYDERENMGGIGAVYKGIVGKSKGVGDCLGCKKCEKRCPQKLKISDFMRKGARMLGENEYYYTDERNAQILIYLLKEHGIKKIITSPGTTNASFVWSVQQDSFFELYSSVDERSAAYMACGMAEESGEPVVLSCTGATASRNYIPALTEAFYRKIPILAVTSSQPISRIGNNIEQVIDRRNLLNDIAKESVNLPLLKDGEDETSCVDAANKAILELNHHGLGPVHINLETIDLKTYTTRFLPSARKIERFEESDVLPAVEGKSIGIFVGAHSKWDKELEKYVDRFCEMYNAVVIYDHTSNYKGNYGFLAALASAQENREDSLLEFDLLIHLGNVSGAQYVIRTKDVWRINPDGKIRNTFGKLSKVFEMEETAFFEKYCALISKEKNAIMERYRMIEKRMEEKVTELPFSNIWVASQTAKYLPKHSVLHLGILNSLRSWNFFQVSKSINVYANTGGFGIDGCISSLIGASIINPHKIYFGVVGDLAFFYDMNSLGNRHIGSNLRLVIVNNGGGQEFKNHINPVSKFGTKTDLYIAAKGHYGNKSIDLIKDYVENLGFQYYAAHNKDDYREILPLLVSEKELDKSMVVEVFTDTGEESNALKTVSRLDGTCEAKKDISSIAVLEKATDFANKEVVLWGTGFCFSKNFAVVEKYVRIKYVCDNNPRLWGEEIVSGVFCISPEELKKKKDVFVVIMLENWKTAFSIGNQLVNLGIDSFDSFYNWREYADSIEWKDGKLDG